jgi:hypothetical protein
MFNGEERVTISTDLPAEAFDEKIQEALESLGQVEISKGGGIVIFLKTSMVSFFSTASVTGKIKATDDGYKVNVEYSIAPSAACWVLAVLLFCFSLVGGGIIFVPLIIDKPNIARAVESTLRDLKDSFDTKKRGGRSQSDD